MNVAKKLKKYRMDAGMTIYTLGERLNVDPSSISYWESGKKTPRMNRIIQLEDMFGVGHRELFSDLSAEETKELEQRALSMHSKKGGE
ncbi:HTH binding domain-like protein [Phage f2b1]|nr:HTH binding domain-like protein [Phage f2b1]